MRHSTDTGAGREPPAIGLGLRDCLIPELLALADASVIDTLEVMIDDALAPAHPRRAAWAALARRWPLIAHGTELGIAGADDLDPAYVAALAAALTEVGVFWYSEHLAFVRAGGIELGHFVPLLDDDASVDRLAAKVAGLRAALPCPLLLENPSDALGLGGSGHARGQRYARALAAAEAGALLDLTNLVIDARNDGFAIAEFLDALDWDRVVEVHLAGGRRRDGVWIDSHDQRVDDEALALLPEVVGRAPRLRAVIVERDDRIPPLARLLDELERVRERVAEAR